MADVIVIEVDCDPALYPKVNELLGQVGVPQPKRMEWLDLLGHATP